MQCRPAESLYRSLYVGAAFFAYALSDLVDVGIATLMRLDAVLNSVHEVGVPEFAGSIIVLDVPIGQNLRCVEGV